ncbi:hypothetical protein [Anaeromicropila herbilytica]|uniref:Uncharacterized protein n=1 Tax=Anaeromicropila herbilytica TaxID=2785025 RepID=A0A7R7IE11_9FIRM|nr:hypothetical protein [Anaeromicropila herbilytica]BCN32137.1 hypothetical protein bsdtb5_34320 [Anaeromicropila herbilytica]
MSRCSKNNYPSGKFFGVDCDEDLTINGETPANIPDGRTDPCLKAPCGEPKLLTLLANAIYDESGINLCRVIRVTQDVDGAFIDLAPYLNAACNILLEVIDYNLSDSDVQLIPNRPNCVSVRLTNLELTFAARLVDSCGRILTSFRFRATYLLEDESDESYNPDTNPTSICTELYAPYGVSYNSQTNSPMISSIGFVGIPITTGPNANFANNFIPQGISIQAMAKVLSLELTNDTSRVVPEMAVGLTLLLRSSYIVEYKFEHAGISVPPKAVPIIEEDLDCIRFVEGDLLAKNVKPLELRRNNRHSDPLCPKPCYQPGISGGSRSNDTAATSDVFDELAGSSEDSDIEDTFD